MTKFKFSLIFIQILFSLFSCSNKVKITLNIKGIQNYSLNSSNEKVYMFNLKDEYTIEYYFDLNYELTSSDIEKMENEALNKTELKYQTYIGVDENNSNEKVNYLIGFYFDLNLNTKLEVGYKINENVQLYYSIGFTYQDPDYLLYM